MLVSVPWPFSQSQLVFATVGYYPIQFSAGLPELIMRTGMFFYKSDSQETDIEWLSDPASLSNGGTRKLHFTNQDANGDGSSTHNAITPPADATSAEHEYRLDWTEGLVEWYVDGAKMWETTQDVPSVPGPWVFNNWANGDIGWSAGPPAVDAVFKIRSIDMYYNTA